MEEEIERWITVRGNHIPILKGESEKDALNRFFGRSNFDNEDEELNIEIEGSDEDFEIKYVYYFGGADPHEITKEEYDKSLNRYNDYFVLTSEIEDILKNFMTDKMVDKYAPKEFFEKLNSELLNQPLSRLERVVLTRKVQNAVIDKYKEKSKKFFDTEVPKLENHDVDNAKNGTNLKNYKWSKEQTYRSKDWYSYTNNCQRCIIAYEMRRRGYNVEAEAAILRNDPIYNAEIAMRTAFYSHNTKYYDRKEDGNPFPNRKALIKQMEKDMLSQPEGSRFVLAWQWKNEGSGHTVNAEKINGKIIVNDGQNSESYDIEHLIERKDLRATTLRMTRVDNLELRESRIKELVKW